MARSLESRLSKRFVAHEDDVGIKIWCTLYSLHPKGMAFTIDGGCSVSAVL